MDGKKYLLMAILLLQYLHLANYVLSELDNQDNAMGWAT